MRQANLKNLAVLTLTGFMAFSCAEEFRVSKAAAKTPSDPEAPTVPTTSLSELRLEYVDSGAVVHPVPTGGQYPATSGAANASDFDISTTCNTGVPIEYTFRITNDGVDPLDAAASPAVTLVKTTDYSSVYTNLHYTPSATPATDYVFSIVSQPTLPVAPGASTTFKVSFTSNNGDCNALVSNLPWTWKGGETAQMVIKTNDPTNPDYSVDIAIMGNS